MGSAHRAPLACGSIAAQAKQDSARAASSPTQALSGNTALLGARGATGAGVCLLDAAAEDAEKKRLRDARRLRKKEQRVERAMEDLLKVLTSHSESVPVSVSVSVPVPVSVCFALPLRTAEPAGTGGASAPLSSGGGSARDSAVRLSFDKFCTSSGQHVLSLSL